MYDIVNSVAMSEQDVALLRAREASSGAGARAGGAAFTGSTRDFDEVQIMLRKQLTHAEWR